MITYRTNRKFTLVSLGISAIALLGGCGDRFEEDNPDHCNFLGLEFRCKKGGSSPPPPPPATTTPPAGTTGGAGGSSGTGAIYVNRVVEYEPNNVPNNANAFSFPAKGSADAVAIEGAGPSIPVAVEQFVAPVQTVQPIAPPAVILTMTAPRPYEPPGPVKNLKNPLVG